jgi:zona occludens toxin (predicted ATPase)
MDEIAIETVAPIQISKILFIFLIMLLGVIGSSGFILPSPAKWHWPNCEWIEGTIVNRGTEEGSCVGDVCYTEYYFKVQPDDKNESLVEVWVAPITYLTNDVGDRYESPVC